MEPDLIRAKEELSAGGYTCVICAQSGIFTSTERGVKPLLRWLEQGMDFAGATAADKVVGKATAFLYRLLGVKAVYAAVISRAALQTLTDGGIAVEYDTLAEHIVNRQGDGICPFEQATLSLTDPQTAYAAIRRRMTAMGITLD